MYKKLICLLLFMGCDYFNKQKAKKGKLFTDEQERRRLKAIADKKIADEHAATRGRPYAPEVGSGGGLSGIGRGTSAAQASGMGGGSRQATSAGATRSGRTDSGWGW